MNQIDLKGQFAIVTGGASGLGYAIVQRLCASGATVAVWDNDANQIDKVRATIPGALWIQADVGDQASLEAALKATHKEFPHIDIFVNMSHPH